MNRIYFTLLLALLATGGLFAQLQNNDCASAIALPEVVEYCSGAGGFNNIGANTSLADPNDYPVCFDERAQVQDVWFSFIAVRDAATISVTGATPSAPGGTIEAPQFVIYDQGCDDLENGDIGCRSPFEDPRTGMIQNGGNIILTDLEIGRTYFIAVAARFGNEGSFELCVNQFDNVPEPSSDCETGVILCDKSPFSVEFLSGQGLVREDLLPMGLAPNCRPAETNSAWYKWTCDLTGTLTFTIDPLGSAINEDIDFAIYELPNGLDDCGTRTVLRQMYSGETAGQGDLNLPCFNETGLNTSNTDVVESCGCAAGDDNFLSPLDMVSGRSYALVIFNFSGSGEGFDISFGGSGTFLGPEAEFVVNEAQVCVGEALTFEDRSTSLDLIVSREWDFGPNAEPRFASGPGPHDIVFGEPGSPNVRLIIETERDCREVANRQEINVVCCDGQFTGSGLVTNLTCPNDMSGAIEFSGSSDFSPTTVTYAWSNDSTTQDISNLEPGQYIVTVSDESGCTDQFEFLVDSPPDFTFDTIITMPSCGGAADGAFEFVVTGGGTGDIQYSLNGSPFSDDNSLADVPVSVVNVRIRDENDCIVEQDIEVNELELGLVQGAEIFSEPVCAGESNGTINIQIANGQPTYQYDFGLGEGFQNDNIEDGLPSGLYTVTARDATGCLGVFDIEITEPPEINLAVDGSNSTCFGTDDGTLTVLSDGGRPGYSYQWSDGQAIDDTLRMDLTPGLYTVSLTDQNGCLRSETFTLTEPNEIFPEIIETIDLTCFGDPTGSFTLGATGGTPDYLFSADGTNFQTDSLLANLLAGDYTLFVQDANGCLDSIEGSLTQPREFIVDAGPGGSITLGFDTILRADSNFEPVQYVWLPDSLACLDELCTRVRAQPFITTEYTVVGINPAGCTDTATVALNVINDKPLYVPTAFSPNGDGTNDGFTVFGGRAVEEVEVLRVYHRWGGLVFERANFAANDPDLGWNGNLNEQPVNSAVFVYYARVRYVNGESVEFSGDVTLVR